MLEKKKTTYFIKIVFSFVKEKRCLELIKYNKNLQTKLGKKLINYKVFGGKYIIYETSKKGKIYDGYDDELIYEGGLINGKMNGKGIEYDKVGNKFEVEYSNGKIMKAISIYQSNGLKTVMEIVNEKIKNAKQFDSKNNLVGEVNEGKGKMKTYNIKGNVFSQFDILNGEKNGKYEEFYDNSSVKFEAQNLKGELNGKAKDYYENGKLKFECEFRYG